VQGRRQGRRGGGRGRHCMVKRTQHQRGMGGAE
jgi:hypothetical protein